MRMAFIILFSVCFTQNNDCRVEENNVFETRTIYSIGDTLSVDDQATIYEVCNGSGNYQTGDSFSFADFNGDLNGGDYKVLLISMNATW